MAIKSNNPPNQHYKQPVVSAPSFFVYRCANSSDVDSDSNPITEITRNYQLTTGKFQFQSFVWNPNVEDPIFIHCEVAICNNQTDGANCDGPVSVCWQI